MCPSRHSAPSYLSELHLHLSRAHSAECVHDAEREAAVLARLPAHAHVLAPLEMFRERTSLYIVMPAFETDVSAVLDAATELIPEAILKALSVMMLDGLAHMHRHGALHRVRVACSGGRSGRHSP